MQTHPRDRYLTVFGRKPVLEALGDPDLRIDKLLLANGARGDSVQQILRAAKRAGVEVRRATPKDVTRLSRNAKQDQGVVADILAPRMNTLDAWLAAGPPARCRLLLLDRLTNPSNIGLILRAATAAGMDGVVVPRAGSPNIGPLVIKASAGVAFRAPILRCARSDQAAEALAAAGVAVIGLRGQGAEDLFGAEWPDRLCFVLGNETEGVGAGVAAHISRWARIPMSNGVESLNVATAGAVVAFEMARRR